MAHFKYVHIIVANKQAANCKPFTPLLEQEVFLLIPHQLVSQGKFAP